MKGFLKASGLELYHGKSSTSADFENPFLWPVLAFGYPFGTPALSKIGRVTSVFIEAVLNKFFNISDLRNKEFV
jgi:hypothetical protein